jgi:hypothetical protein
MLPPSKLKKASRHVIHISGSLTYVFRMQQEMHTTLDRDPGFAIREFASPSVPVGRCPLMVMVVWISKLLS